MKFIKKIPAADPERDCELKQDGWTRLKEPKTMTAAILCALPIGFVLGAAVILLAHALDPSLFQFLKDGAFTFSINIGALLLYIAALLVFMLLHEFVHAVFLPGFIKSDKAFWGFNGAAAFVYTTAPIKKARFIVISLMPLLLLSFVLPALLAPLGWMSGLVVFLCAVNAFGSCVDVFNILLVVFQVPRGYTLINNGFYTYYKRV
jgi:hypothetical protein